MKTSYKQTPHLNTLKNLSPPPLPAKKKTIKINKNATQYIKRHSMKGCMHSPYKRKKWNRKIKIDTFDFKYHYTSGNEMKFSFILRDIQTNLQLKP